MSFNIFSNRVYTLKLLLYFQQKKKNRPTAYGRSFYVCINVLRPVATNDISPAPKHGGGGWERERTQRVQGVPLSLSAAVRQVEFIRSCAKTLLLFALAFKQRENIIYILVFLK